MNKTNNPNLTKNAQILRKNMTKEERKLWYDFLKKLPQTVNRQKVIGKYIVDFYCASANIVIEIDGSQHFDAEQILKDKEREEYFKTMGIMVLRYTNLAVNQNFKGVCEDVLQKMKEKELYLTNFQ